MERSSDCFNSNNLTEIDGKYEVIWLGIGNPQKLNLLEKPLS